MNRTSLLALLFATSFWACNKEEFSITDCDSFKGGLVAENKAAVAAQITGLLSKYTRNNVDRLGVAISKDCGIDVTNICFDCIKTSPAQSSLHLEFSTSAGTMIRELDVSQDQDGKMIVTGVHE